MKISIQEFPKKVKPIRDNEIYSVHDLIYLDHLIVSMTILHPGKATTGHQHEKEEEVYLFVEGEGEMELNGKRFSVKKGDIILIPKKTFHKVFNPTDKELIFLCVFEKYKGRGE